MAHVAAGSRKQMGLRFLQVSGVSLTRRRYKAMALVLTFLAYASFHATRKTTSIVKSVLDPGGASELGLRLWPSSAALGALGDDAAGWAPFDGRDGSTLLGVIDLAFLSVYSFGMYFAGHLGDRLDLRLFLTAGTLGSALFTALFGAGYWLNIHSFHYFLAVQVLGGLLQSTGWPSVVAVVGNWFGKTNRGLVMGVWSANTSVGNICGSLLASVMLKYGWGWSFVVPGLLMALVGLAVFLFLPVSPQAVGDLDEDDPAETSPEKNGSDAAESLLRERTGAGGEGHAVSFMEAWRIPGVAPFAFCLFFSKLVAYTFLYWLPFYMRHTAIEGVHLSDAAAGYLSTLFDVGGVVGGILAGRTSDHLGARAITAAGFMYCAVPALLLYRTYGNVSLYWNVALMFAAGMLVNGPYALITTAVSADLGTHSSLRGDARALATVAAIIDGTGSVGAAIGPMLTGYISSVGSWSGVFAMLMCAALAAGLLLTKLVVAEVAEKMRGDQTCNCDVLT